MAHNIYETKQVVKTNRDWSFNVFVQGSLEKREKILTVHDLGCNHTSWHHFVCHPSMNRITEQVCWIHVEIPGQGDRENNLKENFQFPSMEEMGIELSCVLQYFNIQSCICLGEGAGSNIIARFAFLFPDYVIGVCLIHCTSTNAGFAETMNDKIINWKLRGVGMNKRAEAYLVWHRFGTTSDQGNAEGVDNYCRELYKSVNSHNLSKFIECFMRRSTLTDRLYLMKCNVLVVTGTLASHNHTVQTFYENLLSSRTVLAERRTIEYLPLSDVANVCEQAPQKFAESFQYFLQGLGIGSSIPLRNNDPSYNRGSSMAQIDEELSRRISMS